jgi:hypothetical protein
MKPGHQTTGNALVIWPDMSFFALFPTPGRLRSGEQPWKPGPNNATEGRFSDGLGSNIVVQYSVGPLITLHCRTTAREHVDKLGNQMHPMIQTLFPSNDAVFQDDNGPIHKTWTGQSWFEEHEGEFQHFPWSAQSPNLNITEPLC